MSESVTILYDNGPQRFTLPPHKSIYSAKKKKFVLKEMEYILLENPYDKEKKECVMGKKMILKGPCIRSLYPDEISSRIYQAVILDENQGAIVMAMFDYKGDNGAERKAGEKWIVMGPTSYIPHKYEKFEKVVEKVKISQNEAVYVRNMITSELKMIIGPKSYMPGVFEELYSKNLSNDEYRALGIPASPSNRAFQLQVQKGECVCVIDYQTNEEKYVLGPMGYILGAHEGVKVINTSGQTPKVENVHKQAVVRLGPDFMTDMFNVRTSDNAVVQLLISYKWKFIVDETEKYKIFHGDFIGYSCQSMRSRVRESVSKHEFEKFHTNSSSILRDSLFKDYSMEVTQNNKKTKKNFRGRLFREFNFLIFQLDVKKITPVDKEIERLLNNSIKSSMKIMCQKKSDSAGMESKKNEIINKVEISKMEESLIIVNNANFTKETVEKTKIKGNAKLEKAKSEMEAETMLKQSRLDLEIENLKQTMDLLKGEAGDSYIEYIKTKKFAGGIESMTVVPNDMKTLFIGESKRPMFDDDDE